MWTKMFRQLLLTAALAGGIAIQATGQVDPGDTGGNGGGGSGGGEEPPDDPPGGGGGEPIGPPGDANGDCAVDLADFLMVLSLWGPCEGCPADFDGDGLIDISDLLVVLANWGTTGSSSGAPPAPVMETSGLFGPAPFTVHFNALSSVLGVGDPLTARYQWDFGDPGSSYNQLDGWIAAHEFRSTGSYDVTLTITNESGLSATVTDTVVVLPNNRTQIYVSPSGSDSNSGSSESNPVRTVTKAFQLITDNSEVRVERGHTYLVPSGLTISEDDVRIAPYGSGSRPVFMWGGPLASVSGIIEMLQSADNVVIESIDFDAPGQADRDSVRGILPNGRRITIHNCHFGELSDAVNGERRPEYLLMEDCHAGTLGAYLVWGSGWDYTLLGNSVDNSISEHNIRFSNLDRSLVLDNTLFNDGKSCIWSMKGTYSYISQNTISEGPLSVGANEFGGEATDNFDWSVIERNHVINDNIRTTTGADHVMIRNNIIERDGDTAIVMAGNHSSFNRTASDIRVINNTGVNDSNGGRFLEITSPGDDWVIANNLYVAWNLETGQAKTANVYVEDDDLTVYTFKTNMWSNPAVVGWGDGWHYVWPFWSDFEGYKDTFEWDAFAAVTNDQHADFAAGSLDAAFAPQFPGTGMAEFQPGIHVDFYGDPRSLCGVTSVGAVIP